MARDRSRKSRHRCAPSRRAWPSAGIDCRASSSGDRRVRDNHSSGRRSSTQERCPRAPVDRQPLGIQPAPRGRIGFIHAYRSAENQKNSHPPCLLAESWQIISQCHWESFLWSRTIMGTPDTLNKMAIFIRKGLISRFKSVD
jgi:hypothetical protein